MQSVRLNKVISTIDGVKKDVKVPAYSHCSVGIRLLRPYEVQCTPTPCARETCALLATLHTWCSTGVCYRIVNLPAVTASELIATWLGAVTGTVSDGVTVNTLHLDSLALSTLFLAAA